MLLQPGLHVAKPDLVDAVVIVSDLLLDLLQLVLLQVLPQAHVLCQGVHGLLLGGVGLDPGLHVVDLLGELGLVSDLAVGVLEVLLGGV